MVPRAGRSVLLPQALGALWTLLLPAFCSLGRDCRIKALLAPCLKSVLIQWFAALTFEPCSAPW